MIERRHGTRARYVHNACRCDDCRAANTSYARERATAALAIVGSQPLAATCIGVQGRRCGRKLRADSKGPVCRYCRPRLLDAFVSARTARRHLQRLARAGVGLRAVHEASSLGRTALVEIRTGRRTRILPDTEAAILAVDESAKLGGATVAAGPTRKLIAKIIEAGYSKTALARLLGSPAATPTLQITKRDRVLLRTARAVADLHREIDPDLDDVEVPDDATYVRELLAVAVSAGPRTVSELRDVVEADYGSVTLRTMHRWLADAVDDGVLVRVDRAYMAPEQRRAA